MCYRGNNERVGWVKVCGFQTCHHCLVREEPAKLVCVMEGMMGGWVGSKSGDFRLFCAITIWYMKNLLNWCVIKGIMGGWVGLKYVDFRLSHAITIR